MLRRLRARLRQNDLDDTSEQLALPESLEAVVIGLLTAIAEADFQSVADTIDPESSRITAGTIADVVIDYGSTAVQPPADYFQRARTCISSRYRSDGTPEWHVDAPLWTVDEGSSDLEVRLNIYSENGRPVVQMLDILVP